MNMKKMIAALPLMLLAVSAFGQDAKPTKAQTTEYIKANYPGAVYYHAQEEKETALVYSLKTLQGNIRDIKIDFAGTKVTVAYHDVLSSSLIGAVRAEDGEAVRLDHDEEVRNDHVVITFDLKDIESIDGGTESHLDTTSYEDSKNTGLFPLYLVFKAANSKQAISYTINGDVRQYSNVWVPYSNDAVKDNHQALRDLKSDQIYKAFEHLRKLSGAPEPLRF
jgi:hypothetical protein